MLCPACHRDFDDPQARICPFDREPLTEKRRLELIPASPTPDMGAVYDKRYIVRGSLGGGGMGQIFLAENAFTKEPVAIKVLEGKTARQAELRERFLREARTIDNIEHPNIVQLLDAGARKDGAPYLVMEYLHGESLGTRLRRDQSIETNEALWISHQVASALTAAHGAGVIHRDVKPDNVFLVGAPGRPYTIKLVDFGLARLQGMSALTAMGVTVGTLEYMSPEQAVKDPTGPQSDIYALGVVMYRMLTGALPFVGDDATVLAQHLIIPPQPLTTHVPLLDARIEEIVLTAMRKAPLNRYPAMEDFLDDIERLLGLRPGEVSARDAHVRDVYKPHSPYALTVAKALYKKIGVPYPFE
jgi:serine/threonine-protein kinase